MHGSLLFLLVVFVSSLSAEPLLKLESPIKGQFSGGEQRSYEIPLSSGDFVRIVVDQVNIDLVLSIHDFEGKPNFVWDQEHRNQGRETLDFVVDRPGNYQLEVRAVLKSAPQGGYEIRLEEIRTATDHDRLLFQARKNLLDVPS